MFDDGKNIEKLQKQMAQVEKTLADVSARADFLFDLHQTLTRTTRDADKDLEKQVEKLEGRLKTVEQDLAKLRKK